MCRRKGAFAGQKKVHIHSGVETSRFCPSFAARLLEFAQEYYFACRCFLALQAARRCLTERPFPLGRQNLGIGKNLLTVRIHDAVDLVGMKMRNQYRVDRIGIDACIYIANAGIIGEVRSTTRRQGALSRHRLIAPCCMINSASHDNVS